MNYAGIAFVAALFIVVAGMLVATAKAEREEARDVHR